MALECITNINVDFYDKKYILLNAKQFDKKTRFLSVTCYNHGELYPFDSRYHLAYVRYKKSDDNAVFNFCEITKDGTILVELTEQMLASSGICVADLVIVNRGQAEVDTETGEIINIDRASVLSTMTFHIDVTETAVDNAQIESSYEYSAFNQSLETYWTDFEEVMQTAKSYAVGNAGGIRENEDFDNAKYYYELALANKNASDKSAEAAAKSEDNAKASETAASKSEANAKVYKENANTYMNNAEDHMEAAKVSETNAKESEEQSESFAITSQRYAVGGTGTVENEDEDNAKYYYEMASVNAESSLESAEAASTSASEAASSASAAASSATAAAGSATDASGSADEALASASNVALIAEAAADSATSAANSANAASETADIVAGSVETAKGYAEITQENMESAANSATAASTSATNASTSADNAYNHYLRAEAVVNGLNGAFLPKGTITFAELATLAEEGTVAAGYMYNISDAFTTDDSFRMGAGIEYEAGTNVYYTVDGQWDCFAGTTVVGVKGSAETEYKVGNVDISAENVGAIPITDIATVDEVKELLGII